MTNYKIGNEIKYSVIIITRQISSIHGYGNLITYEGAPLFIIKYSNFESKNYI